MQISSTELIGKRLQLLTEIVTKLTRVAASERPGDGFGEVPASENGSKRQHVS